MKNNGRKSMTLHPENMSTGFDWDHILESYEIMYLVKRSSYEFLFAVPKRGISYLGEERSLFQVRFKEQSQILGFVLDIDEMEDFYEGLSRLMEYVQVEQSKRQENL
jgi:hypothetical protein